MSTMVNPPAQPPVELTVLMPCLDEAETIASCIDKALAFFHSEGVCGEVLIADNGSTDGSVEIARDRGARVVLVPERGYGAALGAGIADARGTYIIMGDADGSYDFSALGPFLEKLRSGWQLVMGNRFQGGIRPGAMPKLHKYLGNPVLSGIANTLFRSPIHDFHCGLRGFDAAAIRGLRLRTSGMEFASEMVVRASLAGLRTTEVPTVLSPDGRSRPPHLRSWRDGWRHLRFLMIYSPSWLFLYPGLILMVAGLGAMAWLVGGDRFVGDVRLGVNTLLYAALAIIVGFEAVGFARFLTFLGARSGELPKTPFFSGLEAILTTGRSVAIGAVLVAIGLSASAYAVDIWSRTGFGNLSPEVTMRVTVPAVTAVILGIQLALSALFMYALTSGPGYQE